MANLLSELERFEQEMKDLGAEPSSTPAPPAQLVTRLQLASPPLPPPRPAANIVVAASPASPALPVPSSASPSTSASGPSPPPSGFLPSQPVSTGMNGPAGGLLAQPPQPSPRAPPPAPLSSVALTSHSLPPRPPPLPVSNTTSAPLPSSAGQGPSTLSGGQHLPWLATGAGTTASAAVPASGALPTSAPPQFTYTRPVLSYPPPTPAVPPPSSVTPSHSGSYFPVPFHLQQQSHPQQQQQHPQYQQPPQQQQQPQYLQYQPQQYQPPPQQATVIQAQPYTYPVVYPAPIPLPQQQQAQQLFQRDAQTITPEALESVKAALASGDNEHKAEIKKKAVPRKAAGQTWEDPTLADWPENDHRLFCGDLGNEVNDEVLTKAFARFSSFNMARVVRDKRTGKTKGYGFVSFTSPSDLALALKEMNGKYVGNRPIKLRKSTWKDRTDAEAYEKQKNSKKPKTSKKNVLHK